MAEGVQLSRRKGYRMPPNTVKVARPSRYGNIFIVGKPIPKIWLHGEFDLADTKKYIGGAVITNHAEAVRLFRKYLPIAADPKELRGKNLACFCQIGAPCHRDVLLELANAEETE